MQRIESGKNKGIGTGMLYIWAMVFTFCGIIGGGIVQNGILEIGNLQTDQLLQKIQTSSWAMTAATIALLMQAIETCAIPAFAMLIIEKMHDQEGLPDFGTALAVALISEIPYDLVFSGKINDMESQNPALGIVIAVLVLYFWKRYQNQNIQNFMIKAAVLIAGMVWVTMLQIRHGAFLLIMLSVLWAFRSRPLMRNFLGPAVGVICSILSPFYLASPMGFLLIHFYNGERSEETQKAKFFVYPTILLIVGIISTFIL